MSALDPRRNAFRADLAAEALRGRVDAPRYAAATRRCVARPTLGLRGSPDGKGFVSELVFGQEVDVYETRDGVAWVQAVRDGYTGYAEADGLGAPFTATHRVSIPLATLYPAPDIKTAPLGALPLNAAVNGREDGAFLATDVGWIHLRHVAPQDVFAEDFVSVAELFLGAPYLWGGGTVLGLDCSGLVQTAFHAAGRDAPRDSDMQAAEIGAPIPEGAPLRRGDLIFWRGHVGIMRDGATLLHANGHHMAVASEPLEQAVARIAREYGPVVARRRP